jgi:hypothetical protein
MRNLSYEQVRVLRKSSQVIASHLFILPASEAVTRTIFELNYNSNTHTFSFQFYVPKVKECRDAFGYKSFGVQNTKTCSIAAFMYYHFFLSWVVMKLENIICFTTQRENI